MKNNGKQIVLAWLVMFGMPAVIVRAEEPSDGGVPTRDRQIEDMKNAFEEITESFRQRVLELQRSGSAERDAALAERDAAIAERDAAIAGRDAVMAERDTVMAERDTARERSESLEEIRKELQKQVETQQAELRAAQDAITNATSGKDAEIVRLQQALTAAEAANARERFALAYNLGNIYKAARDYARAEAEFTKALQMNANDSALHYNMGILYDDNLGNSKKARYHYERFLALAPNDPDAPNVVKWLKELDLK